ncbi:endonuclease/exonuclease/phosphatase family protein [Micromonospora sp. A3M-1-15]|uniref:endonuclease/exonuclease/phosphatase family protein n=1 Tax=Micromonospora sp. A3M-1-15 TaxID=2962035 RepID=UPI0020B70DD7|nr:endonuclease/exonuclease/phosphatase family protein [Micromonospora sp. A3M-1-15]MCP3782692.1 endonuclease/exonuclease/phosphatase family protein [Micromonospora sp. A3M-1-15]
MRHRHLPTVALALGVVVLLDVLRVWLPSIITIFGRAAETPAELLGAFALGWFVLALAAPVLVRRVGARPARLAAAGLLAATRLALTAAPGGRVQLWLACAGLLAGLVWLAATAATVARPVPGLASGLAGAAGGHALLGTEDLVWRGGVLGWTVSVLLVGAFVAAQSATGPAAGLRGRGAAGRVAWLLVGPVLLLAGQLALAPAVWDAAATYWHDSADLSGLGLPPAHLAAVPELAIGLFLVTLLVRPPRPLARLLWPVALAAGAGLFAADRAGWLAAAVLLTAAGLGGCLALVDTAADRANALVHGRSGKAPVRATTSPGSGRDPATALVTAATSPDRAAGLDSATVPGSATASGSVAGTGAASLTGPAEAAGSGEPAEPDPGGRDGGRRRGFAVVGGMLGFAVGAVAYYAAYDLGYPNGWVPVLAALVVAAAAVAAPPGAARLFRTPVPAWTVVLGAMLLTAVGGGIHRPAPAPHAPANPPAAVRVVAYNIRMGFGLDGRLDLDALARAVDGSRPDVVLLSEVDRGWLLNGGHDTLALLAGRLRMPYVFAPAADPVWGDAVLSRFPVRAGETRPLAAHGAPTGAQALGVTLDLGGRDLAVVATHLQPPPGQGPVAQAREVAAFATRYAAGRPLVLGGDLNTEPADPAFAEFTRAGLVDALAAARPLRTSPADDPRTQIDHVFVSPGLTASGATAPRTTASDHLPVAVTIALP